MHAKVKAEYIHLAALFIAGRNEVRYYLQGVRIEPDPVQGARIVATDGHRIAVFHDADGSVSEGGVILPIDGELKKACRVQKSEHKRGLTRRFLFERAEDVEAKRGVVSVVLEPLDPADSEEPRAFYESFLTPIDGQFPDWERVVPASIPEGSAFAVCQPQYMADFCKVAEAGTEDYTWIRVMPGETEAHPILVVTQREDFVGVVMPIRADQPHIPDFWARRSTGNEAVNSGVDAGRQE